MATFKLAVNKLKSMITQGIGYFLLEKSHVPFFSTKLEPFKIEPRDDFDTGCWSYIVNEKPNHQMYVGQDILKDKSRFKKDPSSWTEDQIQEYVNLLLIHEIGHASETARQDKNRNVVSTAVENVSKEMAYVRDKLKEIKCPFSLFNLFEDARIEHIIKKDWCIAMSWLNFEVDYADVSEEYNPNAILFRIIQAQGDDGFVSLLIKRSPLYLDVKNFYEQIIACVASRDLIELLQKWLQKWPNASKPQNQKSIGCSLEFGFEISLDPDARQKFFDANGKDKLKPGGGGGVIEQQPSVVGQSVNMLKAPVRSVPLDKANELAVKFQKIFVEKTYSLYSEVPSKKLNCIRAELARPAFKKKYSVKPEKKNINIVVDLSSSMRSAIAGGVLLVTILSVLARQNKIEGHVILTGVGAWQTFRLPMSDDEISRINATYGGEGLNQTFLANEHILRQTKYNFVYTDGRITDGDLDKNYFNSKGIFTWGLYVNDVLTSVDEARANMTKYFNYSVCRSTVEDLLDAILTQI